MTTSRNRLHKTRLLAFEVFCATHGWQPVPVKGDYEVLRMRHPDHKDPLIVHGRLRAPEHLTTHGNADKLLDQFLGHERKRELANTPEPTAKYVGDVPWE